MTSRTSGFRRAARGASPGARACLLVAGLALAAASAGCRQDMHDTPRYEPLQESEFFADRRASRPVPDGTVARGLLRANDVFYTGMAEGATVERIPMAISADIVARGRDRYDVYCAPCHGQTGEGNGMIVQRGYKAPPSLHDPRLRNERAGYFFDVISRGFGQMPDYAAQVSPKDRWAIVSYIRALQLSQFTTIDDVPESERKGLDSAPAAGAGQGAAGEGAQEHD